MPFRISITTTQTFVSQKSTVAEAEAEAASGALAAQTQNKTVSIQQAPQGNTPAQPAAS